MAGISGNVGGFQTLSAQLTTLEQQNQLMLAAIKQAQLQKNNVTGSTISAQQLAQMRQGIYAYQQEQSMNALQQSAAATASSASAAAATWSTFQKCQAKGEIQCASSQN
jgi:hypothetical protein